MSTPLNDGNDAWARGLGRKPMFDPVFAVIRSGSNMLPAHYRAGSMFRGLAIVAGIVAVFAVLVVVGRAASPPAPTYTWNWGLIPRYLPFLFQGLGLTVFFTVVTIVGGMVLGIFVAAARLSELPPLQLFVVAYIEIMRGTPLLVQLVWVYYALPIVTGIALSPIASVLVALILNMGAFYGEAFRAGIQAIPRAETESAQILGLSYWQRMRYVIVPQATRTIMPVLVSMSISLFKDTSLVAIIGIGDLMYNGLSMATLTYRPLELLSVVALLYFLVAFPATLILRRVEVRFNRGQ